jgi:hypothetical protein
MAKKRAKAKRLTPKRVKFIKQLVLGKTLGQAAKDAGYSPKNPDQTGHQTLKAIQKVSPEILAEHGLTIDSVIQKHLVPLMNAEKTEFFPYTKRGQRKLLTVNVVDWRARDAGLDKYLRIVGAYQQEAQNTGPQFSVVIINAAHRPNWSAMKRANESEKEVE